MIAAPPSGAGEPRRSPPVWIVTLLALLLLTAGAAVLAVQQKTSAPATSPAATSQRVVALGDSVPYGHGLANPYPTPQIGLPSRDVSQGPSTLAYPSLVTRDLGLTMTVRPTNCRLTGDQLAISGAVADPVDNTKLDGQCPVPPRPARNLQTELAAADLAGHPARLVLLQDGADDIDFAKCLEYQLGQVAGIHLGLGNICVHTGGVTPGLTTELSHVRSSLASAIEEVAPHAHTVAVLNYYQPIPAPSQIADDTGVSGLGANLVCTGLRANASATYAAAQVVLTALNNAVAGAVSDARAHHVHNVTLVNVANLLNGHGMCTVDPWVFSGERISDATLTSDTEHILAAKACTKTDFLHGRAACNSQLAAAARAERDLIRYVWRAAHPMAAGQRALAAAVVHQLRGS